MRNLSLRAPYVLVGLVAALALFLRLYKLSNWFYYMFDEEVISYIARRMLVEHHFPLIGGITPLRFHLGPFFYYFSAFWLWVGGLNPVLGWGVLAAVLTTLAIILTYYLGTLLYNNTVGFFASLFMATSYLIVAMDRHYWPLTLNPLLATIVIISLIKIQKGNLHFLWPLTAALIFGSHMDPSAFVLIVLTIFVWWRYKLPIRSRKVGVAITLFLLSTLPLLLFELRHEFYNTKQLLSFFGSPANSFGFRSERFWQTVILFPQTLVRFLWPFEPHEITNQLTFCQQAISERFSAVGVWMYVGIILFLLWLVALFKKGWKYPGHMVVLWLLIIVFVGINLYGNLFNAHLYEQYLTPVIPLFFIAIGWMLTWIWERNRWATIFLVTQLIAGNLLAYFTGTNKFGWEQKWQATQFAISKVGSQSFSLEALGTCHRYGGFRYLFTLAGKDPDSSYVDNDLGYLYNKPQLTAKPSLAVVMVAPEIHEGGTFREQYEYFKQRKIASRSFGELEVIIADTKK